MDWRQPWLWPRAFQYALFSSAGVLGALLLSPWCLQSWQAWDEVAQAQAKVVAQQEATHALRQQTEQWKQAPVQSSPTFVSVGALSQLAQQQGLQLSQTGVDKPVQTSALQALQLQQQPLHLKVQGSWDGWLNWLAQWPSAAPGVTVASLELKADPKGGISAQLVAVAPQSTVAEHAFELASVDLNMASPTDPFSAQSWASTQRAHAEQHPSYARLVAPELLRPRDVLEAFPRERLQYVGQIASGSELEALIKVLPASGPKPEAAYTPVYRLRVGGHLGQDFGKVLAVQTDQLVVQELALTPTGEWLTREVRLPLQVAAP
jgi:Tfp pilus assembly protein PilP